MKFSCERCGKKYATAEKPAPGRVYKIKCKACGHLIVVKASAMEQQTATTELRPPTATDLAAVQATPTPTPTSTPATAADGHGLTLEIAAPESHADASLAAAPPEAAGSGPALEPLPPEPPPEAPPVPVLAAAGTPTNGAYAGVSEHPQASPEVALADAITPQRQAPEATPETVAPPAPASRDERYVDLFGDPAKAEAAPPAAKVEDPFVAAARASLPEGYGKNAGAPDPFAPLREELKTPSPEPLAPAAPASAPKIPVIAKPTPQKSSGPIALIVVGALVLVGILAFVLLGGQKPPAPPAATPPPVAATPAPPPPAAPAQPTPPPAAPVEPAAVPPPAVDPAAAAAAAKAEQEKAGKRTAADSERRSREERKAREREAKAAADREAKEAKAAAEREARAAADREKAAREARAAAEREAKERERTARENKAREERERQQRQQQEKAAASGLAEAAEGLSQDQVQKVLSSSRKAFETCIVGAGKAGAVALDGRRVMLRLNIQPTGAVTYPTLDDVTLNGTDLGSCLKSAARVMVFPKFKGDPMHVEVPLVLAGGR